MLFDFRFLGPPLEPFYNSEELINLLSQLRVYRFLTVSLQLTHHRFRLKLKTQESISIDLFVHLVGSVVH